MTRRSRHNEDVEMGERQHKGKVKNKPRKKPRKNTQHAADEEEPEEEGEGCCHCIAANGGKGVGCCKFPWFQLLYFCLIICGVGMIGSGLNDGIQKLDPNAYNYGLVLAVCPIVITFFQLLIGFFEEECGQCIKEKCDGFCFGLEWVFIWCNAALVILMSFALMFMSGAVVFATILSTTCPGGPEIMVTICPLMHLAVTRSGEGSNLPTSGQLCECPPLHDGSAANFTATGKCLSPGGWKPTATYSSLCTIDLVTGAELCVLGFLFTNAGLIGMLAMSMRSRGIQSAYRGGPEDYGEAPAALADQGHADYGGTRQDDSD